MLTWLKSFYCFSQAASLVMVNTTGFLKSYLLVLFRSSVWIKELMCHVMYNLNIRHTLTPSACAGLFLFSLDLYNLSI